MIVDGIHYAVPFNVYAESPEWSGRVSPGILEHAMETMEHVKAALDGELEHEDTKPLLFGGAFHCRLLEPERYRQAYAVTQQCQALTKDGKGPQCSKPGAGRFGSVGGVGGQWFCDIHKPENARSEITRLSDKEAQTIEGMRKKLLSHPASRLLHQAGRAEVCIAWTCPRTGIKCKTRLDKWIPDVGDGIIPDLKSVESAHPRGISEKVELYGWARAGAMRQDGIEALTGKRPEYYLVVQKSQPYSVVVPSLCEETMRGARWEVRSNLQVWADCVKKGVFPGYSDDFVEISAPGWKINSYRNSVPHDFGEQK